MLASYLYMLRKENSETITKFETDDKDMFKYIFMTLAASIKGFKQYCRTVIVGFFNKK